MTIVKNEQAPVNQMENMHEIIKLLLADRRLTFKKLAAENGISYRINEEVLMENLKKTSHCCKVCLRLLTNGL